MLYINWLPLVERLDGILMKFNRSHLECQAVILIGGEAMEDDFRPLSPDIPKPCFPVAGEPLLGHHIRNLATLPQLRSITIFGLYPDETIKPLLDTYAAQHKLPIRYVREEKPAGTGGWIPFLREGPQHVFVVNGDIYYTEPPSCLQETILIDGAVAVLMVKKLPQQNNFKRYGWIGFEKASRKALHYVENSESFVSEYASCGLTLVCRDVLQEMISNEPPRFERLLKRMVENGQVFCYETTGEWGQVKSCQDVLRASSVYLKQMGMTNYVHPTAQIAEDVLLKGDVVVSANCVLGSGVFLQNCILLPGSVLEQSVFVRHAVVGRNSYLKRWSRIDGDETKEEGLSILGSKIHLAEGKILRSVIVLPCKIIKENMADKVIV